MSTFDTKDGPRALAIVNAAQQAAFGAHYINGSDGGITGMNAAGQAGGGLSASRKIYLLEDRSWEKLAVHAAIYGGRVCKGRYAAVKGAMFLPNTAELTQLKDEYVPSLSSHLPGNEPPFPNTYLYPRRGRSQPGDAIYLGEDCRNKRHFDCISFVNWVLTITVGRLIWYEEKDYFKGAKMNAQIFPATHTSFKNADIAVRIDSAGKEHIGFLTSYGQMIHARTPERGVEVSDFEMKKDDFTRICRLPDSFF